jgi:hydroxymethylpyrimidine pyrophosphatase-like HAD family hydrolase
MNDTSVALNPDVNQSSIGSGSSSTTGNDTMNTTAAAATEKHVRHHHKYTMVALDLDGTLLQSNHQMADIQAEYLRSLHGRGLTICFATGRAAPSVYEHVRKLALPCPIPVVCSNGARGCLMSATATKTTTTTTTTTPSNASKPAKIDVEELFYLPVPKDVVRSSVELANSMGFCIQYYVDDHGIFANPRTDVHRKLLEDYTGVVGTSVQPIEDDFESLLESTSSKATASKLLVRFEKGQVDEAYEAFQELLSHNTDRRRATIIRAYAPALDYFLEILHPDVNKGHGLKRLLPILNDRRNNNNNNNNNPNNPSSLELSKVIAMGDGTNDVEFLILSGLGLAMKNGHPDILELMDKHGRQQQEEESEVGRTLINDDEKNQNCGRITSWTNDEHGVMKTLMSLEAQGLLQLAPPTPT